MHTRPAFSAKLRPKRQEREAVFCADIAFERLTWALNIRRALGLHCKVRSISKLCITSEPFERTFSSVLVIQLAGNDEE